MYVLISFHLSLESAFLESMFSYFLSPLREGALVNRFALIGDNPLAAVLSRDEELFGVLLL